jgi:hypothetical protein
MLAALSNPVCSLCDSEGRTNAEQIVGNTQQDSKGHVAAMDKGR